MGLLELIITIAVVGCLAWAIVTYVPMLQPFRNAIIIVCVIGLVLYVLNGLGLLAHFHDIQITK